MADKAKKPETYKIPRNDFCMCEAMPFSQHWEARVPVPIGELYNLGEAFHASFGVLMPGDEITVCSFDKAGGVTGPKARLSEVATFRVIAKITEEGKQPRAEFLQIGQTVRVPKPDEEIAKAAATVELYKVNVGGGWEVRDARGNVIEQLVSSEQASAYIKATPGGVEVPAPEEARGKRKAA